MQEPGVGTTDGPGSVHARGPSPRGPSPRGPSPRGPSPRGPSLGAWITDRGPLWLVLTCTALVRAGLADRNSYWLDELYSVQQYVLPHATAGEAVRVLAETSIHPPLYQFLLFHWVSWFGPSETATRTLSNLAVLLAVVVFHAAVTRLDGVRSANAASVVFALTFGVVYYGLETRSYAITLLLACVSLAGLAWATTGADGAAAPPGRVDATIGAVLLTLGNVGLLLTHYYNAFLFGAQAVVLAVVLLTRPGLARRGWWLAGAVAVHVGQLGIVAAIWGSTFLETYQRNEGRYATDRPELLPHDLLDLATEESFWSGPLPGWMLVAGATLITVLLARTSRADARMRRRGWLVVAATAVAVLTVVIAYLTFLLAGAERMYARYLVGLLPVLTLVVSLTGLQVGAALRRREPNAGRRRGDGAVTGTLLVLLLVAPGTVEAVTIEKVDWRGTASAVTSLTSSDPEHRYTVWEPSFRRVPMFDHYLERQDAPVRIDGTITRTEDDRGTTLAFEDAYDRIETHDFLVLPFAHQRAWQFPTSLARLDGRYPRHLTLLDELGQGLIVYDLRAGPRQAGG